MLKISIGVIGEDCVGKSQIIDRYINNNFNEHYIKTISPSFSSCEAVLEENHYDITVKDIPSNQEFQAYQKNHAFIVVFDINDQNYIENVRKNINKTMCCPCVIIFGNKADDENENIECKKELEKEFKKEIFIGSAKTGFNVDATFGRAVELVTINYDVNAEGKFVKKVICDKKEEEERKEIKEEEGNKQSQCCLLI